VVEEHLGGELTSAAHAHLVEDRLQVILHRVRRKVQAPADLGRRGAGQDEPNDVLLAPREAVRGHHQRHDVRRLRRLHRDHHMAVRPQLRVAGSLVAGHTAS
jgi:hypothetical protein